MFAVRVFFLTLETGISTKGAAAETTDFGPVPDMVVLLFDGYAMILVCKNQNFIKNMLKVNCFMSI